MRLSTKSLPGAVLALSAALLLAGCGVQVVNPPHALSSGGEQVSLIERRIEVASCTNLGMVQGRASSVFRADIAKDILIDARNKAAFQGANRIVQKPSYELIRNNEMSALVYDMYLCRGGTPTSPQEVSPGARQPAGLQAQN